MRREMQYRTADSTAGAFVSIRTTFQNPNVPFFEISEAGSPTTGYTVSPRFL